MESIAYTLTLLKGLYIIRKVSMYDLNMNQNLTQFPAKPFATGEGQRTAYPVFFRATAVRVDAVHS
jgi:hypothetical protein